MPTTISVAAGWNNDGAARAPSRRSSVRSPTRTSGRRAPCRLGRAKAGRERVFFAHIRSAPGLAVTSAAAGVVDFGYGIDPHHGIARAARLGLGFARVLAFLRRRRDGCRRCERHAPALGHEYALALAACLNGGLVGAPVVIALAGCLLLRDRGLRQRQQSYQYRTHSEGRFHHTYLRENSAHAHGLAATASARRKLPRWQPQCGPQPLTGSVLLFAFCSYDCQEQRENNVGQEKTAAPQGAAVDCRPVAPAVNAR